MSKTTIKELASSLSEKHDLSKADAERFVAAIFEVINDGLEDDKLVKVKGLGAFKIIGVAARKSVDVNTGEPIVIEGRNKISFTPDASMRDDVNKPFSQFETVAINDGVDFSSIDNEYGNGTESTSEKEVEISPEIIVDNVNKAEEETTEERIVETKTDAEVFSAEQIEENKETQKEQLEEENIVEAHTTNEENIDEENTTNKEIVDEANIANEEIVDEANIANEEIVDEANIANEEIVDEANIANEEIVDEANIANEASIASEKTVENENIAEEEAAGKANTEKEISLVKDTEESEVERKTIDDEETHKNHALKALMITAVVIVIGCLCGGYYLFTQIQRRDSHIEMLEKQMRLVAQHQKKKQVTTKPNDQARNAQQAQDSTASKTDIEKEAARQVQQVEGKQEPAQADSKPETLKADGKQAALQDQYNKDVRIRTGAYVIVGIKKTVTVRPGQTMDGISRLNLGPGMECYIEAVNGGKRELKAGESINIPELKLKKRLR